MIDRRTLARAATAALAAAAMGLAAPAGAQDKGELVYMTPGLDLAFWRYVSEGVRSVAEAEGYGFSALDSTNDPQAQLQNAQDATPARGRGRATIRPAYRASGGCRWGSGRPPRRRPAGRGRGRCPANNCRRTSRPRRR